MDGETADFILEVRMDGDDKVVIEEYKIMNIMKDSELTNIESVMKTMRKKILR
jgi:hypothetical protein